MIKIILDTLNFLNKRSKLFLVIAAVLLNILIGLIDYLIGYDISLSVFYLLPLLLVVWFVGRTPAIFLSVLSVTTWVATEHKYFNFLLPLWDIIMRLAFFNIIIYILVKLKKNLENEKKLARIDNLTGIANTRYFAELADREFKRAIRFKQPVTIVFVDIDNFKKINDDFGHSEGDKALCMVARTIKDNIRDIDTAARFGGDEFAILMPGTGEGKEKIVVDRVQKHLLEITQKNDLSITFSIGVVTCNHPKCRVDDMLREADHLMYSVKNSGKNNIKYKTIQELKTI